MNITLGYMIKLMADETTYQILPVISLLKDVIVSEPRQHVETAKKQAGDKPNQLNWLCWI